MILVHHASLEAAAADLRRAVAAIAGRMDHLEAELMPLRSDWSGAAQAAYLMAKSQWDAAIAEMASVLDQTQAAVVASNAEYAAADQRGARAFGS
ncbi:MAG: WXG100 family type VII secretion target [Nocardioides sp.]